jgi:uncharacterized protein (DUF2267 family)
MNPESTKTFLLRVRELTGIDDDDTARRAIRAVTALVLEQLSPRDRAWLAACLPQRLDASPAPARPADTLHDFYDRVASREGVEPGFAVEHAQCVCRAIGEQLDERARDRLARLVPDDLAELFAARESPHAPMRIAHHREHARATLSEGHASSSHPLSQSQPHTAHAESVARSDNPHADTKLSSSSGSTQQRERETLADHAPDGPRTSRG